jgi:succinyl-CoA synthetase beta subunit
MDRMKLREYQAKSIFAEQLIAIPRGFLAVTADEAEAAARKLGTPVVLKPQLGVKGRGKLGGIAFADTPLEAMEAAGQLFQKTIKGEPVRTLLVEEKLDIAEELYLAVTIDYAARRPVLIASQEGGVEIEVVAERTPERVQKTLVSIVDGPSSDDLERLANQLGLDVARILERLYNIFRNLDAELVEVNPLIRTTSGDLVAADAVLNINEEALFRHPDLDKYKREIPVDDPVAEEARQKSWTYIDLSGDIGILSSGAGLTMAILDLMNRAGGRPANFLDTAQIDDQGIYEAFELLSRAGTPRVMLVNIFAGLNRCDALAEGIKRYLQDHPLPMPVVVRMIGNLEDEGHRILKGIGITPFKELEAAIDFAVKLSRDETKGTRS